MKKTLIYIVLCLNFASCNRKTGELPVIYFDDPSLINLEHNVPLDSIVERTEIIHLTSDSNLIIGKIKTVFESENHFYILENNRVLQFNKEGVFINLIGRKGKGPGEYVSPWALDVDESNRRVYVMDYFGRKMLQYNFDGSFAKQFMLPDNLHINGFCIWQDKILYTSSTNSVSPEIFQYDQSNSKLTTISSSDREMRVGEALMGTNFVTGQQDALFLFHYFNDTVFSLASNQLKPEHLIQFGKLKINYDELLVDNNKRPNGARLQVHNMIRREKFTFITYGVTKLKKARQQTRVTGFYCNDLSCNSPSVSFTNKATPLFDILSGTRINAGHGNTLLRAINAVDVLAIDPDFDISENDNPVLIKYFLK